MPNDTGNLLEKLRAAQLPPSRKRKRIREDAGATLNDLAVALGVSETTVWKWEKGTSTPRRENAVAYRKLLDELEQASLEQASA